MKLPNGDQAIVEDGKLLDYVLNQFHPVGRHHAALFEALLGIRTKDYQTLKSALLDSAKILDVEPGKPSPFGRKYVMRLTMTGLAATHQVVAVWIIENGQDQPRLVTCYVE